MLSENDIRQIEERGSDLKTVEGQIERFKKGFPYLHIHKAATKDDGIKVLEEDKISALIDLYDESSKLLHIEKFVPASGAASRMFKKLYGFIEDYKDDEASYKAFVNGELYPEVYNFFKHIEHFAFYESLKKAYGKDEKSLEEDLLKRRYKDILKCLLDESGLNYGSLPKGLLEFHKYDDDTRTPVEEHLVEGALYSKGAMDKVNIHFTVSPEHKSGFDNLIKTVADQFQSQYKVTYNISFSEQKPHTDTIAVALDNNPFRESNGQLFFRPGGHGALIENLNDIKADIIFIKNIDNVVPDRLKETTVQYKKALAGMLLETQQKIFNFMELLEEENVDDQIIDDAFEFLREQLCIREIPQLTSKNEKVEFLRKKLNRPIRVCGMVKNEGEPGGGPFFAQNSDGTVSLQIVETSQVDMDNPDQGSIVANSTHFNPVDVVVSTKNYKSEKFDLTRYTDPQTGFISKKSKDGKDLKALELPGLWNGAMADWNTIFVEVPIETFNPVKTVNDLLRPQHQPKD